MGREKKYSKKVKNLLIFYSNFVLVFNISCTKQRFYCLHKRNSSKDGAGVDKFKLFVLNTKFYLY